MRNLLIGKKIGEKTITNAWLMPSMAGCCIKFCDGYCSYLSYNNCTRAVDEMLIALEHIKLFKSEEILSEYLTKPEQWQAYLIENDLKETDVIKPFE